MSHKGTPMFKQSPNTVHEPNCVNVCRAYNGKIASTYAKNNILEFWSVLSYIKRLKKLYIGLLSQHHLGGALYEWAGCLWSN